MSGPKPPIHLLTYLESLGAGTSDHTGRLLVDHLAGTYALLVQWGASESLCYAGLFHSVYGTPDYREPVVALSMRKSLQDRIGPVAEELVYEFARLGHARTLQLCRPSSTPCVRDELKPMLLELCAANFLEQIDFLGEDWLGELVCRDADLWRSATAILSPKASARVIGLLESYDLS
jgi:hypothetical protein